MDTSGASNMKVLVAAVFQSSHLSGVARHGANVARCLLTQEGISDVYLVVAPWQYESMKSATRDLDPRLHIHSATLNNTLAGRTLWYWSGLPALAAELGVDIVHIACPAMVRSSGWPCPTVVTLHDLYQFDIPENFGGPLKLLFNRFVLRQSLGAVDSIACVSESTARRLGPCISTGVQKKAVTIYNSVDPGPPMALDGPLPDWDSSPFLLCVAQHRRNKNVLFAMRVFQRLLVQAVVDPRTKLVVVGIEGPETPLIHEFIREAGLSNQIVLLRGISDAQLQWCYGNCQLLLAPSIVEGFGLPIVEAMLHGCRVVCSDIPVFREVGEDYCHYASLEPSGEEAFVRATRDALQAPPARATGLERFSGRRIGEEYLQLYNRLRQGPPFLAAGRSEKSAATIPGRR
jgi:glycosyltransferase involved in cell wall biosynthesis